MINLFLIIFLNVIRIKTIIIIAVNNETKRILVIASIILYDYLKIGYSYSTAFIFR